MDTGCPRLTGPTAAAPAGPAAPLAASALEGAVRRGAARALTWFTVRLCGSESQMRGGLEVAWENAPKQDKRSRTIMAKTDFETRRHADTRLVLTTMLLKRRTATSLKLEPMTNRLLRQETAVPSRKCKGVAPSSTGYSHSFVRLGVVKQVLCFYLSHLSRENSNVSKKLGTSAVFLM